MQDIDELLERLSAEQMTSCLRTACASSTTVYCMVCAMANMTAPESNEQHYDDGDTDWCKCGRCREMPTVEERLCCRRTPGSCVTQNNEYRRVVLDRAVLLVTLMYRNDLFALIDEPTINELRHTAYRQYVLWKYGHLGRGNRVVVPSCSVWCIRDCYPSLNGIYTGYRPRRLPL